MQTHEFKQAVWQHLSRYRESVLGIEQAGEYRERAYGHILPRAQYQQNILPSIRPEFWEWFAHQSIRLHKHFEHLSSSQAACFNLFFPFVLSQTDSPILLKALGLSGSPAGPPVFEYIPDPEEYTNIDVSFPLASGARVLIEMKYTEDGFKPQRADPSHILKFAQMYSQKAPSRLKPAFAECEGFLSRYQIARNILHLGEHDEDAVLFLVPRGNQNFHNLSQTLEAMVLKHHSPRVRIVYLEDIVTSLRMSPVSLLVQRTIAEYAEKYLPVV